MFKEPVFPISALFGLQRLRKRKYKILGILLISQTTVKLFKNWSQNWAIEQFSCKVNLN